MMSIDFFAWINREHSYLYVSNNNVRQREQKYTQYSKAHAGIITLDGLITDGEFLSNQFVPDPSASGGGSFQQIDVLGLTNSNFQLVIDFNDEILNDTLTDGLSFIERDAMGAIIQSNILVSGILGDISLDGFSFANSLRVTGDRAVFEGGVFSLELFLSGSNTAARFLGTSPLGVLRLTSAPVPSSIQSVGALVEFLNATTSFSSGTFPVEFFVSSAGGQKLVNTDIAFDVSANSVVPEVPLPAGIWLFLSGLVGFGLAKRRRS